VYQEQQAANKRYCKLPTYPIYQKESCPSAGKMHDEAAQVVSERLQFPYRIIDHYKEALHRAVEIAKTSCTVIKMVLKYFWQILKTLNQMIVYD
jgi:hypothetical protein